MFFLFLQTWIWILLAGLLGLLIGWLIWGRQCGSLREQLDQCHGRLQRAESSAEAATLSASIDSDSVDYASASSTESTSRAAAREPEPPVEEVRDEWRPASLDEPEGEPDDLKRIKGVGPVIQKTLNELGIYHFQQVAAFTDDNVKWVDNYISFPGRIRREEWVAQAADLAEGRTTEFAGRYDRGEAGQNRSS